MSYNHSIRSEAQYVDNLGYDVTGEHILEAYKPILEHWFPTSHGYTIDPELYDMLDLEPIIVRRAGGNIILIAKIQHYDWTGGGHDVKVDELANYIKLQFDATGSDTIYGLVGIGLRWMVCEVQKSGNRLPTTVIDGQDNIASNASYAKFRTLATLIYNIA